MSAQAASIFDALLLRYRLCLRRDQVSFVDEGKHLADMDPDVDDLVSLQLCEACKEVVLEDLFL